MDAFLCSRRPWGAQGVARTNPGVPGGSREGPERVPETSGGLAGGVLGSSWGVLRASWNVLGHLEDVLNLIFVAKGI